MPLSHQYKDISHFRAPYKDSYLSGLGAFGEIDTIPERIVKLPKGDVLAVDLAKANAARPNGPAVIGMAVDWGQKIAAPDADTDSALLLPVEAAVNERNKGNPNIDSVVGALARFVKQGYYIVVPQTVDSTKIGKYLIVAKRDALPRVASPSQGSIVIAGPADAAFGFTSPGGSKMSVAAMAGYASVGLLVAVALSLGLRKRRR